MKNLKKILINASVFIFICCCCAFLTNAQKRAGTVSKSLNGSPVTKSSASREQFIDSDSNPALASYLVFEVRTQMPSRSTVIKQTVEIIRKRLDLAGVLTYKVEREINSTNHIVVKLPDLNNIEFVKLLISNEARFEVVHLVSVRPSPSGDGIQDLAPSNSGNNGIYKTKEEAIRSIGKTIPQKRRVLQLIGESLWVVAELPAVINGSDLHNCEIVQDPRPGKNYFEVSCSLNDEGKDKFSYWTSQNINHYMGIVINGKVTQMPTVQGSLSGPIEFYGKYSKDYAQTLTITLLSGDFPVPVILSKEGVLKSFRKGTEE